MAQQENPNSEIGEDDSSGEEVAVPKLLGGTSGPVRDTGDVASLGHRFADWLWEVPTLIDDPEAPVIQRLRIIGRYHGQWAWNDEGIDKYSEWESRRLRLGLKIEFLENFTAQSVWKLDGEENSFDKSNIDNQWIAWRPDEAFGLKIGQQKPLWSLEWSTSSNAIPTFERSLLVNQLNPEHSLGIYASGVFGPWAYGTGWFRGDLSDEDRGNEQSFALFSVARDFEALFDQLEDPRWRLDYLYNDGSEQVGEGDFRHLFASGISGKLRRGRLSAEALYATGGDSEDDVFGFTILPSFDIVPDRLQFVTRYHFAHSNGDVLRLQDRYETAGGRLGDLRGDSYHSLYGGLNWYLRGNRLKLMGGAEYARMKDPNDNGGDYRGWTLFGGVRLSF